MSGRAIGLWSAFGVLFIWTGFLLFSRMAGGQGFTPWDVAALRYGGSFLAALPILAIRGLPRVPPLRALFLALTAGIGFPLCAYWGFRFAPAAHGAVLLPGLLPFLAAALWWWAFAEPWGRRRSLSLLLVALGMGLLALDTFGAHPGAWRGDLCFAAGCAIWTAYMWGIRRWGVGALDATLCVALLCAPLFLPLWWFLLPSAMAQLPLGAVLFQLGYQGVLAVVVAGFLFTQATVMLGGPLTATVTSVVPVLTALGAWPLLGEALGWRGLLGVALVTGGMVVGSVGALTRRGTGQG